jgi:betaine reductase
MDHLRSFDRAVDYAPNQAFIGNFDPDDLFHMPAPIYKQSVANSSRWGAFGEIMPEGEFYGIMKICDEFDLIHLDEEFVQEIASHLREHPLVSEKDLKRLGPGMPRSRLEQMKAEKPGLPLYIEGDRLVGYVLDGHEEDTSLKADILLENLTSRAAGVMALRSLVNRSGAAADIDYLLGCGEEAVGDRYNRGGGNLAKAIGELCGATNATGSDVKAFCCGPVHAMVIAGSLVASNLFENVVLVAGGSLAKLA